MKRFCKTVFIQVKAKDYYCVYVFGCICVVVCMCGLNVYSQKCKMVNFLNVGII